MYIHLENEEGRLKIASIKFRLYIALLSDVDVDNFPKAVGATISSNVLLPGKKHHIFDAKFDTINPSGAAGESQGTVALTIQPQIEGLSKKTLESAYNLNGERVIAIWEDCKTGQRFIAGSPCSGGLLVAISSIGKMDDGFYGAIIDMVGGACPDPFYFYEGPIVLEDPEMVPADSVTFALTDKFQYQLSENTVDTVLTDITGVTGDDTGRIIELIGGGVNFPTKINSTVKFILRNGVPWIGTQGSKISFQIVMVGPSQFAFFEVHRS